VKIYTKTGDKGYTGLWGGTRVAKSHKRINAYGTIDELNSYLGLLTSFQANEGRKQFLHEIQRTLFSIGSILAADPEKKNLDLPPIENKTFEALEEAIDNMEKDLVPLKYFILPGGNKEVSFCHIARTVCRRAERNIVKLIQANEVVPDIVIIYLNRLSDYLFVLARKMGKETGAEEIKWISDNK